MMKTYKELINEAFNRPYKWKVKTKSEDQYTAVFKTDDGTNYEFNADYDSMDHDWNVEFNADGFLGQSNDKGTDAFRILATIKEIFEKWAKSYKPDYIMFAAEKGANDGKNARAKIYDRFIKMFSRQYGYSYTKRDISSLHSFWFELERKIK